MLKKNKEKLKKIRCLEDVEEAIRKVADIDVAMAKAEAQADVAVQAAKKQLADDTAGLEEERAEIVELLKNYSEEHRSTLYDEGKKSCEFRAGIIGYRQNPDKVEVSKDTADLLIEAGFANCVQIKKEPVKAALKNFDACQLEKLHVRLIPGSETFYVKPEVSAIPA